MPRNYRTERNGLIQRYYGAPPSGRNPGPNRSTTDGAIVRPQDGHGLPAPVNSPYPLYGHCIAWSYRLNVEGYGTLNVDGRAELDPRVSYRQTRGSIPEDKQVNHLCDRPYCFQPSHLYAGDHQDNRDDAFAFRDKSMFGPYDAALMWQSPDGEPMVSRMRATLRTGGSEPFKSPDDCPFRPQFYPTPMWVSPWTQFSQQFIGSSSLNNIAKADDDGAY